MLLLIHRSCWLGTAPPPKTARSYTSSDEARGATRYVPLADQWVF